MQKKIYKFTEITHNGNIKKIQEISYRIYTNYFLINLWRHFNNLKKKKKFSISINIFCIWNLWF